MLARTCRILTVLPLLCLFGGPSSILLAQEANQQADWQRLDRDFRDQIAPILQSRCFECHSGAVVEGEIDLSVYDQVEAIRREPLLWERIWQVVQSRQMPPKDSPQLDASQRQRLLGWLDQYLRDEARSKAGDPGNVVLRRLNNAEYTYTVRDLTGIDSLDPVREFPVDSAAGEGFTNVGQAMAMSPAMVTKYLDAGKAVADHLVLLPSGLRFSPSTTRRDWTDEYLTAIRNFYAKYSSSEGAMAVNLQGIQFDTNQGGRLPLKEYLQATLDLRSLDNPTVRSQTLRDRHLTARYANLLNETFNDDRSMQSPLLLPLLRDYRDPKISDPSAMIAWIHAWQSALWRFQPVGQIGRLGGPKAWQEPLSPLVSQSPVELPIPETADGQAITIHLTSHDAGDGDAGDTVLWTNPRLTAPGRPDLPLRQIAAAAKIMTEETERWEEETQRTLDACAEAMQPSTSPPSTLDQLASRHDVDPIGLAAWLDFLGIQVGGADAAMGELLTQKMESAEGYDFVKGWVGSDALSIIANRSDQHVRIPGNMKPHSVAVHPAPNRSISVGWRSPIESQLQIQGAVQHAHPECGNGVLWVLELRRGNTRQRLAEGVSQGAAVIPISDQKGIAVRKGDAVVLTILPRDANHSCDLTAIDLAITAGEQKWDLAQQLSPDLLLANPHADLQGNPDVWHFFSEPTSGSSAVVLPAGSLLAQWQAATDPNQRSSLAERIGQLVKTDPSDLPADHPDRLLRKQLRWSQGPRMTMVLKKIASNALAPSDAKEALPKWGLPEARFGLLPDGSATDPTTLVVPAPQSLEIRIPAELAAGRVFQSLAKLAPDTTGRGSVQVRASLQKPDSLPLQPQLPLLVADGSPAEAAWKERFQQFRDLFPVALCYTKIVPVDEVVTLNIFFREDDQLKRLMLVESEQKEIDRLWDELLFVSREPLQMIDAHQQLQEFATQDRQDLVPQFAAMKEGIDRRAAEYRSRLIEVEPLQVGALRPIAAKAFRRPITDTQWKSLVDGYHKLRSDDLSHEEAMRLSLARILVSPAFLYRAEHPQEQLPVGPLDDWQLASRLSYFLWSSMPDEELWRAAGEGKLKQPEELASQVRRMLKDPKVRRLAIEFGCQWLHVHGFDRLDEKSEKAFPEFASLRSVMYEETIQMFIDFFQNDRPMIELIESDAAMVNEPMAKFYGIQGVEGDQWRRVEGVARLHRGGILGLASTLARQSGASRTSPILRGNWLSESLLGEKLPKPPKGVPQLPEEPPEGFSERQLIEMHSSLESCSDCHQRIDPFGFAMEQFDGIGKFRQVDLSQHPIDARATLFDGTLVNGVDDLRRYIAGPRREDFLRQFQRKLLGYALGRSVALSDLPLIDDFREQTSKDQQTIGRWIEAIVLSPQFRNIRRTEPEVVAK